MGTAFIALLILLAIQGFGKLYNKLFDWSEKIDTEADAFKEHKEIWSYKGKYYLTQTGEELRRDWNSKINDYEYKSKNGEIFYPGLKEWREKQRELSEYRWNSVFQWDKTPYSNHSEVKGIRYREKSTGHVLCINTIYVRDKECKVYIDLNTMTYIRRTDGEINRELRFKKYCPNEKDKFINTDDLNRCLLERTKSLRKAINMDEFNPHKGFALMSHDTERESDWEEAKMPWFGDSKDMKLLEKRLIF